MSDAKKLWQKTVTTGALGIAALAGGGCDVDNSLSDGDKNRIAAVNSANTNAVGTSGVAIEWPEKLKSKSSDSMIDLTDVAQVANAMGVSLNGSKDQALYEITFKARPNCGCGYEKASAKPITVANIIEGAAIINAAERFLMPDRSAERGR